MPCGGSTLTTIGIGSCSYGVQDPRVRAADDRRDSAFNRYSAPVLTCGITFSLTPAGSLSVIMIGPLAPLIVASPRLPTSTVEDPPCLPARGSSATILRVAPPEAAIAEPGPAWRTA